jgi:hypothetical protein
VVAHPHQQRTRAGAARTVLYAVPAETAGPAGTPGTHHGWPNPADTATLAHAVIDADFVAATPGTPPADAPVAAVVAVAAIGTWLGVAGIRTRHAAQARRAIDMTASIAGTRPPALTIRGLA